MRIFVAAASARLTDHAGHGEGLICHDLLRALAGRGHDIVACTRRADLLTDPPFEVVETGPGSRLESLERLGYALGVARRLRRCSTGFDVVWWMQPLGVLDVVWRPGRGVPFVVGPYNSGWPAEGPARRRRVGDRLLHVLGPLLRAAHRRAMARTDVLLLARPSDAGDPFGHGCRTVDASFGVDVETFAPSEPSAAPVVAYVGSLEEKKGVRILVEAFGRVAAARPDARLVVAGDGPLRAELEVRAGELAPGRVTFLGPVPRADVPAVLAGSRLVCVPSLGEPFGMVVLEAMAAARPVVATAAGGPAHLLDAPAGGVLVPLGDAAAIAAAIIEVLDDPARGAAMGRHNRRLVEERHTIDASVDRIEAALLSVAR